MQGTLDLSGAKAVKLRALARDVKDGRVQVGILINYLSYKDFALAAIDDKEILIMLDGNGRRLLDYIAHHKSPEVLVKLHARVEADPKLMAMLSETEVANMARQ
jgi:hypothetical protein